MKYIMLFLLAPVAAFAACPPESMEVEYVSPVTYTRRVTCAYMHKGEIIKHGPETELDKDGKVIKTTEYNNGEPGKAQAPKPKNLPGAEEFAKEQESFAVVTKLLSIFSYDKTSVNDGDFKVSQCDKKPKDWAIGAITKKDIPRSYSFEEKCDVSGSFTASFKNPFPVSFMLRNLKGFTDTSMTVVMSIKKAPENAIRYRFEAGPATVTAPSDKIEFKAWYEVDVDPMSGVTKFNTQGGQITLLKVGDKPMNVERPLLFNR